MGKGIIPQESKFGIHIKCPGIIQLHVFKMDGINLVLLLTQIQRTGVQPYGRTNPSSGVICAVSSSDPLGEVKGKKGGPRRRCATVSFGCAAGGGAGGLVAVGAGKRCSWCRQSQ